MINEHFSNTKPTTAWYRQFWPWFLIVLPTIVVIASFITLGIAIKYADTPVSDDYVQHGLTVLHKSKADASQSRP